jgi:hypothetical protein
MQSPGFIFKLGQIVATTMLEVQVLPTFFSKYRISMWYVSGCTLSSFLAAALMVLVLCTQTLLDARDFGIQGIWLRVKG